MTIWKAVGIAGQMRKMKSAFKTAVKEKSIDIQTVKDIIQGHEILSKIDARKVFDKVRCFIKEAESKESGPALPTETETQQDKLHRLFPDEKLDVISLVSRKGGTTFTDHQTEIYWRLFRDLIESNKRITQNYVKTTIEEDDEARTEIVGFTPQQLVDKVRTERRKIARLQDKKGAGRRR